MSRFLLIIGLWLGLSACGNLRQEVELPDLVAEPSRLVVACFIAPQDSTLAAVVARSRPLLDSNATQSVPINDAIVMLSDGQRAVQVPYDPAVGYYRAPASALPIRSGQSYSLTVSTPDGRRVTATAIVPGPVPLTTLHVDSEEATGQLTVRATWQNPATTPAFYRLRGQLRLSRADTLVQRSVLFAGNRLGLFTDAGAENRVQASPVGSVFSGDYLPVNEPVTTVSAEIQIDLMHTSEPYYRYHAALTQQRDADGNPFAEPVPIPTNIVGGLGCFGAYNRSSRTLKVR